MTIRIATFNVENLDSEEGQENPKLERRAPVLRAYFQRLRADIVWVGDDDCELIKLGIDGNSAINIGKV